MVPLAADESLHGSISRGLRRRGPDIDLVLVEEAGLKGSGDPDVLAWAAAEGRVLVAEDRRTMIGFAWGRVRAGQPMPGLLVRGKGLTIGKAVDELLVVAYCGDALDFKDQVRFLPL